MRPLIVASRVTQLCAIILLLTMILVFSGTISVCDARKRAKPPLIEDNTRRRPTRPTHCAFGNHTYEIEERWRPNLEPFGVFYCIRCECVAVQRKNRIVARVRCKNFKNDCPKPTCDNPVLLSERCCKTCPGEDYADLEEDLAVKKLEHNDDDMREFSVLLTGRGLTPMVPTNIVARAYLSFVKRHLNYTLHYSGSETPTYIRFTDEEGNILEEHEVASFVGNVNSSKVCGIWRKVPKVYRTMMRKGKLHFAMAIEKSGEAMSIIGGKVMKNDLLHTEIFSALLTPDLSSIKQTVGGGGGIALLSPMPNSVYVTIHFNGIFSSQDARDVPIFVRLLESESDRPFLAESMVTLPKVHSDLNSIRVKIELKPEDEQLLAAGKLVIRVSTRQTVSLSGFVKPKNTCTESNYQLQRNILDDATNNLIGEPTYKCYYEGEIYEDGAQWKAQHIDCEMCSCQRGRVKCEQEICPKLQCSHATTVVGACCAICPNQIDALNTSATSITKGCYFEGDKKFHFAGTRWHPYLPPFGFDKCSMCTCLSETLEIKCERNTNCPPLTCPEHEAYRESPMDCCKRCPNIPPVKAISISTDQLGDQRSSSGLIKGPNELLASGGCRFKGRIFANGDEWHPTVQPFGEVKCVKCHCKDSIHKCKRTVCPKITACSIVINKNNECCPICADDNDDLMMKNQPLVVHNRKRGSNPRKNNKGRHSNF